MSSQTSQSATIDSSTNHSTLDRSPDEALKALQRKYDGLLAREKRYLKAIDELKRKYSGLLARESQYQAEIQSLELKLLELESEVSAEPARRGVSQSIGMVSKWIAHRLSFMTRNHSVQ